MMIQKRGNRNGKKVEFLSLPPPSFSSNEETEKEKTNYLFFYLHPQAGVVL